MEKTTHFDLIARLTRVRMKAVPEMDGFNPHFKNKYATLKSVYTVLEPALADEGLGFYQTSGGDGEKIFVTTHIVCFDTGEEIHGDVVIPLDRLNAPGTGSAYSYGRRYGLSVLTGIISDEDDDGEGDRRARQGAKDRERAENVSRETSRRTQAEERREAPEKGWKSLVADDLKDASMLSVLDALRQYPNALPQKEAPAFREVVALARRSKRRKQIEDILAASIVSASGGDLPPGYYSRLAGRIRQDADAAPREDPQPETTEPAYEEGRESEGVR